MRDEWFIRGNVPMTKCEVRAVSISKLELNCDSILFDIGAGTGSVAIESARFLREGRVYAVEQKPEAATLIEKNAEKFNLSNVVTVCGTAPACLCELPVPTHVFLGGTSGAMEEILNSLLAVNKNLRVVINLISLESLSQAVRFINGRLLEAEIVSIQVSKARKAGSHHLMEGQNPVYVVSFGGAL